MTTLFNVGDKIKFEIVGEIIGYTAEALKLSGAQLAAAGGIRTNG